MNSSAQGLIPWSTNGTDSWVCAFTNVHGLTHTCGHLGGTRVPNSITTLRTYSPTSFRQLDAYPVEFVENLSQSGLLDVLWRKHDKFRFVGFDEIVITKCAAVPRECQRGITELAADVFWDIYVHQLGGT